MIAIKYGGPGLDERICNIEFDELASVIVDCLENEIQMLAKDDSGQEIAAVWSDIRNPHKWHSWMIRH